jgi:predicted metalloprotease with PDZ domain
VIRRRLAPLALALVLLSAAARAAPPVDYYLSLARAREHVIHVRIHLAGTSAERDLQLPVWNALYQVRDFAQDVRVVRAHDAAGRPLPVHKVDKTTWRISGAESGAEIEYDMYADKPGPYGAQLNLEHCFLNLAEILMYPLDARAAQMTVTFTDVPGQWRIATTLPSLRPLAPGQGGTFAARDYDHLVDAPIELGTFDETSFQEGGATYRIVVDGDEGKDYDLGWIKQVVRRIVTTEVAWMGDRPFSSYLFIYHLPRNAIGGGGMEHAFSTAIELSAARLKDDPVGFESITAHEFFHLWNVKRIRPQGLEPIDYTKENYTDALWFSEGVTSTVADYTLLQAGMITPDQLYATLSREIRNLQLRPAHLTQSAEESSLETWFDKYPSYRLPERSISYYNKGEILGVLLDLAMRQRTGGAKSLRDLFQYMDRRYARQSIFFPETAGIEQAVEAVTGQDFSWFFQPYVAGTAELPYDQLLSTVGLRLEQRQVSVVDPGFLSVRNFDNAPVVVIVNPGSDAERAGLVAGDAILAINGKPPEGDVDDVLASQRIGDTVRLRVSGRRGNRELKFRLGGATQSDYRIVEEPDPSAAQRARRAAWLAGQDQPAGAGR